MSLKTKLNKSINNPRVKIRKQEQRNREGNYFLKYNLTSQNGVTYYTYSKYRALKLPKPRFSLGLWDKFIGLPPEVGGAITK